MDGMDAMDNATFMCKKCRAPKGPALKDGASTRPRTAGKGP